MIFLWHQSVLNDYRCALVTGLGKVVWKTSSCGNCKSLLFTILMLSKGIATCYTVGSCQNEAKNNFGVLEGLLVLFFDDVPNCPTMLVGVWIQSFLSLGQLPLPILKSTV